MSTRSSETPSKSSKSDSNKEYDLPRANVFRIAKKSLPKEVLLVSDSKVAFSKAAVVFIMYLTAAAQDQASKNKRSTLMADDVLAAIDEIELSQYKEQLLETLKVFRKNQAEKKANRGQKKVQSKSDDTTEIESEPE
ncbi:DNA polymerase epsilon subunit [Acrasis kona]|uniref:DNA polymerase epsilon subunit n=1 Tax=Acrasis kona TaxID=1008807 RepID=A0AAW2Z5A4_9EUKA